MKIPKCKHCGSRATLIKAQARGPIELFYDDAGIYQEAYYDELFFNPSTTVRCSDCLKIRRDLALADGKVVEIIT